MPGSVPRKVKADLALVRTRRGVAPAPIRRCPTCGITYAGEERFCPTDGAPLRAGGVGDGSLSGRTIAGRYLVRHPIGEGGMGVVYLADHIGLRKPVAIKFLREKHTEDRDVAERFRREAQTTSRIGHDNIVAVTDIGEDSGRWYIVMEHLAGRDLAALLRERGRLEFDRAVWIVSQVLRGLAAAHAQGILHRDMKPENVFLARRQGGDEIVKIMDFGISKIIDAHDSKARLTSTGAIIGTPIYMAPEQAHASPNLDHRVDIYAAGVMLYQMLAGRPPFVGGSPLMLLTQHVTDPPPPITTFRPDCPRALAACIHRALAKNPAERHASADELRAALERAVPGAAHFRLKARRSWRWLAVVAAAVVVLASAGIAWAIAQRSSHEGGVAEAAPAIDAAAAAVGGSLDVDSSPRGADVFIDGVLRGQTPLVLEDIAAGTYEIAFRLEDFSDTTLSRQVSAGARTSVFVVLAKAPATPPAPTEKRPRQPGQKSGRKKTRASQKSSRAEKKASGARRAPPAPSQKSSSLAPADAGPHPEVEPAPPDVQPEPPEAKTPPPEVKRPPPEKKPAKTEVKPSRDEKPDRKANPYLPP